MGTNKKLKLIAEKAKQDKKKEFISLIHHINEESLAECYKELKKGKACGIDGVRVEEYGENLEENIRKLIERMKRKEYTPKPVKRVYIPKKGKISNWMLVASIKPLPTSIQVSNKFLIIYFLK